MFKFWLYEVWIISMALQIHFQKAVFRFFLPLNCNLAFLRFLTFRRLTVNSFSINHWIWHTLIMLCSEYNNNSFSYTQFLYISALIHNLRNDILSYLKTCTTALVLFCFLFIFMRLFDCCHISHFNNRVFNEISHNIETNKLSEIKIIE